MQAMARGHAAARGVGLQPTGHMRFFLECLFLALPQGSPGSDRHIGDREKITCYEIILCQLRFEHPVEAGGFLGVSIFCVG